MIDYYDIQLMLPVPAATEMSVSSDGGHELDDLGQTCLIAMDSTEEIHASQLLRAMSFVAPRSEVSIEDAVQTDAVHSYLIRVDNQLFACAIYDGRLPEEEFAFALRKSIFWPDAAEAMASHHAFCVISGAELQERHGLIRAQAVALTRLAASLAEILPSCGVLWNGSLICSAPQRIAAAPAEIASGKWPVDVWIGYQFTGPVPGDAAVLGVRTRGAAQFLGFEIEVPPFPVGDRKEPVRILYNAVGYLMNYGNVIRDGQLVEVQGERRTEYRLHLGANGKPGLARLSVLEHDHRKLN